MPRSLLAHLWRSVCDKGNSVTFNSEACVVTNKRSNKVVLTGVRKGNVYLADFNSLYAESATCLISKASQVESCLWHKKLSHLNFKTMNELVSKDLLRGIPQVKFSKDGLSDNRTEFKNSVMRLFCEKNGIMHEFSAVRTLQQNGVVERKNRNQTDQHGKFDAKADEEFFVGYVVGKAYRVFNLRTNIVMESVHVVFDDKKIERLQDGDFHERLKFDNMEMICEDSDDDSDQEPVPKDNAKKSTTNEVHNSTSIERQSASSVERQSTSFVDRQRTISVDPSIGVESQVRSQSERTPSSSQRSINSG
ncbi:hypothetical protein AgCh_031818 [Apium graveolens]